MAAELHIASLVVHTTPKRVTRVADAVASLPGACVHATTGNGKVVVTLEAGSSDEVSALLTQIQRIDGVLSAALVYQCADTVESMNEEIPDGDVAP